MRKRHRFEAALLAASMWAALLTGCRSGDRAYQETAKGTDGPQARQETSREPDEVAAGQPDGEKLVDYAAEEQDRDERPEIVNHIEDLEQYDTVFVGFPNMEQGFESVLCA